VILEGETLFINSTASNGFGGGIYLKTYVNTDENFNFGGSLLFRGISEN
jgi:predicted outer membrane repeat protein